MKILIVDDASVNLNILVETLRKQKYNLSLANSGESALMVTSQFQPHLILLDIVMPGMNGFETCQKLKSNEETKEIPIIFLSARSETEDIVNGFKFGAVDYIVKPFSSEEVLARVRTQLTVRYLDEKNKTYIKELEKSNRELDGFASIAAHDLKAPLRNIKTLGGFLKEDYGDILDKNGNELVKNMKSQANDLSKLIDSILDYSRMNRNLKPFETIDLKKIVDKVIENLKTVIDGCDGMISIGDLPTIECEPTLINQLFQNLISNALKFHIDGKIPMVDIYSQFAGNGSWEIIVNDNGIGFEQSNVARMFEPFQRLVARSEFEGSGIGLATCKKIIDFHNGTITAESEPGKGATFFITLPEKQS